MNNKSGPGCSPLDMNNAELTFTSTPAFSKENGFVMGQNKIAGPLSHLVGISGDMPFSIFTLCQFTKQMSRDEDVTVFKLFANTLNNNGISLVMKGGTSAGATNTLTIRGQIAFGNSVVLPLKSNDNENIAVKLNVPMMINVIKDYGRLQVSLIDVGSKEYNKTVLVDKELGAHAPVVFSNTELTINQTGNWGANMHTFACSARALGDKDLSDWFTHYKTLMRQFDIEYQNLNTTLEEAKQATTCTFDALTCAACSGVKDWSNMSSIMAAGPACMTAINAYCTRNPGSKRCECWNLNNPAYNTTCAPLRQLFQGTTASECKPPQEPTDKQPPSNSKSDILTALITPENIAAIGKVLNPASGTCHPPPLPPPPPRRTSCPPRECKKKKSDDDDDGGGFLSWLFGGGGGGSK